VEQWRWSDHWPRSLDRLAAQQPGPMWPTVRRAPTWACLRYRTA